jgi:hypothetical protein
MLDLHRDKGAIHNFSGMWKVRKDSRNKQETKRTHRWGARLCGVANQSQPRGLCLHHL